MTTYDMDYEDAKGVVLWEATHVEGLIVAIRMGETVSKERFERLFTAILVIDRHDADAPSLDRKLVAALWLLGTGPEAQAGAWVDRATLDRIGELTRRIEAYFRIDAIFPPEKSEE
jgi:hypothetical protein